jgi:hypothetical protein
MDKTTWRRQEQLAECQEQIEKSREMIAVSIHWLTAYQNSVNRERRNLKISEGRTRHFIASAKTR